MYLVLSISLIVYVVYIVGIIWFTSTNALSKGTNIDSSGKTVRCFFYWVLFMCVISFFYVFIKLGVIVCCVIYKDCIGYVIELEQMELCDSHRGKGLCSIFLSYCLGYIMKHFKGIFNFIFVLL